jgi:pimeloyl-ACP methyl ester carboxylesterase
MDLPAAVQAVKKVTQKSKLFYLGHSMGGMLGYAYAGAHQDLEGLITVGAAAE